MELSEVAPPGREKQVKALKKEFPGDKEAPYKIAWAQHNKKKLKEEDTYSQKDNELKKTSSARKQRYKTLHSGTNKGGNVDVNEGIMKLVRKYSRGEEKKPQKDMSAGGRARRKLQRREYASKVSGSEDNVPDNIRDHKTWKEFKKFLG